MGAQVNLQTLQSVAHIEGLLKNSRGTVYTVKLVHQHKRKYTPYSQLHILRDVPSENVESIFRGTLHLAPLASKPCHSSMIPYASSMTP